MERENQCLVNFSLTKVLKLWDVYGILHHFSLIQDLISMYCWCSSGAVLLRLKVGMFNEFGSIFGPCLSLNIFIYRNSPVYSFSRKS